jgi:hypothetical protein
MVQIQTNVDVTIVTTIKELRQILQTAILQYGDEPDTQINLHVKGNDIEISTPNAIQNHLLNNEQTTQL